MVRNFILSILAGGLLTCLSVTAEELNHYVVAATIIEDGVVLGAPTLTVIPGEKTSVQVSGDQGYELSLTLSPATDGHVLVQPIVITRTNNISPSFLSELGKETHVRNNNLEFKVSISAFESEGKVAAN